MTKFINIKLENNPNISITVPINQIVGVKVTPYLLPYHYGHLIGSSSAHKYILEIQLCRSDNLKIPITLSDYQKIMKLCLS